MSLLTETNMLDKTANVSTEQVQKYQQYRINSYNINTSNFNKPGKHSYPTQHSKQPRLNSRE